MLEENPKVAKFREQGLKFLPEMEFLFKGTVATGFAAYAPSEDSRQHEELNIGIEETYDNIDNETEMEVNETEIEMTTQTTSSTKGHRKKGREGDKRIGVAARLSAQLDRVIQKFEGESADDPTSIKACVSKLKVLPGLVPGSDLFFIATRLMKKRQTGLPSFLWRSLHCNLDG
ncbi:Myb/SANT-like DNA-binding domain protein [Spatholobus suberectus]|nr:Myb/SANT-like DNA-binding domain protein [Spatholobus suberectus]